MDNSLIIDAVRAALERGGQHILIAPDGGVSIWPDTDATVTRCKDCKNWGCTFVSVMEGMFEETRTCNITEMATKPDDFCSYAEVKDNADGETPLSS